MPSGKSKNTASASSQQSKDPGPLVSKLWIQGQRNPYGCHHNTSCRRRTGGLLRCHLQCFPVCRGRGMLSLTNFDRCRCICHSNPRFRGSRGRCSGTPTGRDNMHHHLLSTRPFPRPGRHWDSSSSALQSVGREVKRKWQARYTALVASALCLEGVMSTYTSMEPTTYDIKQQRTSRRVKRHLAARDVCRRRRARAKFQVSA